MTDDVSEIEVDPGSALEPNPLLEGYGPPVTYSDIGKRLAAFPLSKVDWKAKPPNQREYLLDNPTAHYVPIRTSFDPAMGLQTLVRRALALINPLILNNRVRVNRIALCETSEQLIRIGHADGAGGLWDGITGTGRSQLAIRVLKLVVPEQVIDYGPSEACGWTRMRQAVWVYVDQPSNGTRMGLLKRVLSALDKALGTDYSYDNRRIVNLDALLVEVCAKLATHRVAVLVIDENHEANLADSPWMNEFVLFYQSVMNLGISILLIGNPLAFVNLLAYGQPVRRLMVGGIHHFLPAPSASEAWWKKDFVPRMRTFSVVEECNIDSAVRDRLEFDNTAGVPGLFPLLNTQAQRIALRRGGTKAVLTEKDITAAAESPFYLEVKRVADCVRDVNAEGSLELLDIPDSAIAGRKKPPVPGALSGTAPKMPNIDEASFQVVKKMLSRFKQQQSRAGTKLLQKLEVFAALTPAERKMIGLSEELESAAMQLMAQREKAKVDAAAATQAKKEEAKRAKGGAK